MDNKVRIIAHTKWGRAKDREKPGNYDVFKLLCHLSRDVTARLREAVLPCYSMHNNVRWMSVVGGRATDGMENGETEKVSQKSSNLSGPC